MTAAPAPSQPVGRVELGAVSAVRPDLSALDRIGARIVRGLGQVFGEMGGSTKFVIDGVQMQTFAEWKGAQPEIAVARYRDRSIKGGLLVAVPMPLIATLVDIFYGGAGTVDPNRLSIGVAEQRMFDRLATKVGEVLAAAWTDTEKLAPILVETLFSVDDLAFCKTLDLVAVQRFATSDGEAGNGALEIIYPLAGLRGLAGLQGIATQPGEDVDPAWRTRLSDAVMHTRLPVRTVIARPTVPLSRLLTLTAGDFIPLTLPNRVPVTVAGRLLAHGTIGEANGRAAVKIDRLEQGAFLDD